MTTSHMPPFFLGCPVWSCAGWKGQVYPASAPQKSWLKYYSETFLTVEGNTTFYAIPSPDTVQRWIAQVKPGFQFALKFPRVITHEQGIRYAAGETQQFLEVLGQLHRANCLGPTFIQFPEQFSPQQLPELKAYLRDLPREFPFAVEVRDHAWFHGAPEQQLNEVLADLRVDRVIFDSRPLFSQPPSDPYEKKSQVRKPQSPVRAYAVSQHPFLRLVGRNKVSTTEKWINEWVPVVAEWIRKGKQPFVFTHTPDDRYAPDLAAIFHRKLAQQISNVEAELSWPNQASQQMNLF
ncbi:MAG: DUF72 domain-containing protein [Pirellulaceae bacterium]|nr:DUF72 domain-containing protein [Pirellulaceae bacterium]MDG2105866.1 DUF72 domain-containing protein [Pirellulaceae bacterium]